MFTIYYHPKYWRNERILLTKTLKHSKFLTLLEFIFWKLNFSLPSNLVFSGPQKLVNNLIRTFKNNDLVSFNNFQYTNAYIVSYDDFGKKICQRVIKNNPQSKIIVGPLYNLEQLEDLVKLVMQNQNIKILVPSKSIKNNLINDLGYELNEKQLIVSPIGIAPEEECKRPRNYERNTCLIYIKKRKIEELDQILKILKNAGVHYKIFEYGKYRNSDLIQHAKNSEFGIIINKTESQGIATQEIMSTGLPLIVNGEKENNFWDTKLSGSAVPYWSDDCGIIIDSLENFEEDLSNFLQNIKSYNPINLIIKNLTFEQTEKNLIKHF